MSMQNRIRELRLEKGYSQDEVAKRLGYKSFTTIQKWETGLTEPSIGKIYELADLFNVSVAYLLCETDNRNPNYYDDPSVDKKMQELKDNPQYRILFEASRKLSEDDLKMIVEMIKRMLPPEERDFFDVD